MRGRDLHPRPADRVDRRAAQEAEHQNHDGKDGMAGRSHEDGASPGGLAGGRQGAPFCDDDDDGEHHEVAIIGAGFSGIGAAIKLDEAGFCDCLILEDGDGVGGAWHWNTYPGVAVDIPSFSYQFSFEQRSDWSRIYARGRRAQGLRGALRRQVRAALADPLQHQGRRGRVGRGPPPLAARDRGRRRASPLASSSARPASSPSRSRRTSRGSTSSPATSCTPRAGITTRDLTRQAGGDRRHRRLAPSR